MDRGFQGFRGFETPGQSSPGLLDGPVGLWFLAWVGALVNARAALILSLGETSIRP